MDQAASSLDKALARVCASCLACRRARRRQRGFAFWLVKRVELRLCPFCRAYERVYGCKAHEPTSVPAEKAGDDVRSL